MDVADRQRPSLLLCDDRSLDGPQHAHDSLCSRTGGRGASAPPLASGGSADLPSEFLAKVAPGAEARSGLGAAEAELRVVSEKAALAFLLPSS